MESNSSVRPEIPIINLRFPDGVPSEYQTPGEYQRVIRQMFGNPEEFGAERIRAAVKFFKEETKDPGGAIRYKEKYFAEDCGDHQDIYKLYVGESLYDRNVIVGFTMNFMGVEIKKDEFFDDKRVRAIRPDSFGSTSPVIVPRGIKLAVDDSVFQDNVLRLGVGYASCWPTRDFGRGKYLVPHLSGLRNRLVVRNSHPFTEKRDTVSGLKSRVYEFNNEKGWFNYSAEVSKSCSKTGFRNLGPDPMPIFFLNPNSADYHADIGID